MPRALALVLALVVVGPSNAACPSGYTATCPSGFSVPSTVDPETISATNLEGCVWFCKCDSCFGCTTTDTSTNEVLSNVDILTRVDVRNNAGGASNLQTYMETFYGSRYDDALDASCADSEKKKMKKKATRSTRLGEDQRGSEGAASTFTTASLNVPGSTKKTVARDESLVSVNEGTEFDASVNSMGSFGSFGKSFGGGPTPPPTSPSTYPLLDDLTEAAFELAMNAVTAADVAKVKEWGDYAYTTLNHENALTASRLADLQTAIRTSLGSDHMWVTSKSTSGHEYAEVSVCKTQGTAGYLYKYNIFVSKHSSATASGQPLLFSRVAGQLEGCDQKRWAVHQAGQNGGCNTGNYVATTVQGATMTTGAFVTMDVIEGWNDNLAALEPHVRGAISNMRFDIINA
jgi:hypothetical protein